MHNSILYSPPLFIEPGDLKRIVALLSIVTVQAVLLVELWVQGDVFQVNSWLDFTQCGSYRRVQLSQIEPFRFGTPVDT